ncbi:MAG: hypothetical protein KGL39_14760 [Patescibacteria group bacterium]|nr:hypothetical protein [Patescibacteria group bacterium]
MGTPTWQPGTQYAPGALVVPKSNNIVVQDEPYNNSFESGLTQWAVSGEHCTNAAAQAAAVASTAEAYDGSQSATASPLAGDGTGPSSSNGNPVAFVLFTNNYKAPVTPGKVINFSIRAWHLFVPDTTQTYPYSAGARIAWYDSTSTLLGYSYATSVSAGSASPSTYPGMFAFQDSHWVTISGQGVAPKNAAYASLVGVIATTSYATQADYLDLATWDYTSQGYPSGLTYEATQATTATSGATEPTWPLTVGGTVVDGGVTWTAGYMSSVTWTASSILASGATQPAWPAVLGGVVLDNSIEWTATDGRITDKNCPQSKVVAIAAGKVFAADNDIIRFCATASPQDWSASQDAGYIPFGLQTYGNESCAALALYRSNLVAFNSLGYQMWQVDPDPTNIAILDAEPVGCTYSKSPQPVNNDLVFLSPVGIRNIGTAGASGNLQAGQFGKQVDPIVIGLMKQLAANGWEARGLFNPGTGQYWLLFGYDAIVLSMNGASTMSWSHYEFPEVITDWTVDDGVLYLRAGDLVWKLDPTVLVDDAGGTNTPFRGYMAWNYIDAGPAGYDKQMEGFDLTIGVLDDDGQVINNNVVCNVSFGYNQSNRELATEPYAVTGDTIPGTLVPMPMTAPTFQPRLDFGTGQNWGWSELVVYATPVRKP